MSPGGLRRVAFFGENTVFEWPWLPLLIFVAEVIVVTLSTLRVISISRGWKVLASMLGLVEISIWLVAIGQVMQNLSNPFCFIAFAAGFTMGNYLGLWVEEQLALGYLLIRVITRRDAEPLLAALRTSNHGVTHFNGDGATGPVHLVFTVIPRRRLDDVVRTIEEFDSRAFYSVDTVEKTTAGIYPMQRHTVGTTLRRPDLVNQGQPTLPV